MKILPLPVKRNKSGKRVADISTTDYYRQIADEVIEAYKEAVINDFIDRLNGEKIVGDSDNEAEELVDIITTCVTRLHILGYDEYKRQKLYAAVNEKNRKRGYFDD